MRKTREDMMVSVGGLTVARSLFVFSDKTGPATLGHDSDNGGRRDVHGYDRSYELANKWKWYSSSPLYFVVIGKS